MNKGTQLWPGDKMRAFFRAHIRRTTNLDESETERLATALVKAINRMLVWEMPPTTPDALNSGNARGPIPIPDAPSEKSGAHVADPFNPFTFSVIVVLAKHGREGLLRRLQDIKSAENLRALAEAQHVPIDSKLKRPEDIRKAIIAAAEQRLEDRKAAAS